MCHQNIMRCRHNGACGLLTHFMIKHASPSDAFDVPLNRSSFPCSRCRTQYFPQLGKQKTKRAQNPSRGKGGHCEYHGSQTHYSIPVQSVIRLAHDLKQPKPTFHIKTSRHYLDRKSGCPFLKVEVSSQRSAS